MKLLRTIVLVAICALAASARAADPQKPMFAINEDNSHFFASRQPDQMTVEGLDAFVDQYADTKVTHLILNVNASRANFTNPARDAIWEPNRKGVESTELWPQNCKLLEEKGIDPYKVWIARCYEKNISPWISMRMNDLHNVDDLDNFQHSSFWVSHPEFWRVPNEQRGDWFSRALNYKHEEVRKYAKDFVDVLIDRYDFDGLELDWMRFGAHLTPGNEANEAECLTEVVKYARDRLNEKGAALGRKIALGVRVPTDPDAAALLGMDAVAWAKEGLVDLIVPSPFWATTDFDIPMEKWNERLEGVDVKIVPCAEFNVRSYPNANSTACTLEQARGFAASEEYRGRSADVYLFNWMDCQTRPVSQEKYRELLATGFAPDLLASVDREVPLTYRDTVPNGFSNNAQLPKGTDAPCAFRVPIGKKPQTEGSRVVVGLAKRDGVDAAAFSAKLNGVDALKETDVDAKPIADAARAIEFAFPVDAFQDGNNEFVLEQREGTAQTILFVAARLKADK